MSTSYKKYEDAVNDRDEEQNHVPLKTYSKKDGKWDGKKLSAFHIEAVMAESVYPHIQKQGARTGQCADGLHFGYVVDPETGELRLKLKTARFCHCRHCPICDWRRSLRAQAMFRNALPKLIEDNPRARWIFLTLTVENCPVTELRETIKDMNQAFMRMLKRKPFSFVKGWIKKVEVTQEQNRKDYAHPHFHVLLQVNESYFKNKGYLTHEDWVRYWTEAMRSDVDLSVDVRAMRKKFEANNVVTIELLKTFNYSVKTANIVENDFTKHWFLEYMLQVHALKFLTSGGTLKNIFKNQKEEDEEDSDFINLDENGDPVLDEKTSPELYFFFKHSSKRYVKNKD